MRPPHADAMMGEVRNASAWAFVLMVTTAWIAHAVSGARRDLLCLNLAAASLVHTVIGSPQLRPRSWRTARALALSFMGFTSFLCAPYDMGLLDAILTCARINFAGDILTAAIGVAVPLPLARPN